MPSVRRPILVLFAAAAATGVAGAAAADPCKAIPDRGPAPAWLAPGSRFSGPVTYVGDGDSLCVAVGPAPSRWVEVRLADVYAPELASPQGPAAKQALTRITLGRRIDCTAGRQSYDRVVGACTLGGRSLGGLLREAGVVEGGRGRR